MKKTRRMISLILALALCAGLLAGCGTASAPAGDGQDRTEPATSAPAEVKPSTELNDPPREDQLLRDANSTKLLDRPAPYTACAVIKRQSNPERKEDIVYVRLTAKQDFILAEQQYRFLYIFYDEGGWILEEATPDNEDEWTSVYLDAAGNDILEDMVWLDAFDEGQIQQMTYIGEAGGICYVSHPDILPDENRPEKPWDGTGIYDPYYHHEGTYDQNGNKVLDVAASRVFLGTDGKPRFVREMGAEDRTSTLLDASGKILANYRYISGYPDPDTGLLDISEGSMEGKITENGQIAEPLVPIDPDKESTSMMGIVSSGPMIGYFRTSSGVYFDLERPYRAVNEQKARLISDDLVEECYASELAAIVGITRQTGDGFYFRLYDIDGRCRTPEFYSYGQPEFYVSIGAVRYDGRWGILPKIVSDQEIELLRQKLGLS